MRRPLWVAAALLVAPGALAQQEPAGQPEGGAAPPAAPAAGQGSTVYVPWGVPPPGTDINAGLGASSRPTTDINASGGGFDFDRSSSSESVRGSGGGAIVDRGASVPDVYTVQRGDTLWDLSRKYFGNPYRWPQVWGQNPQILNPHWIYPGDEVRLRSASGPRSTVALSEGGFVDRRPLVPRETVFLRSQGYIDDPNQDVWGQLMGAREDQLLLGHGNYVYLRMKKGVELEVGQILTIFDSIRAPERVKGARRLGGYIVKIKGSVRITHWDPKKGVARGLIVESVDVIERGAYIGPMGRRIDVVPPRKADTDVWARVVTSITPHVYYGQHQVVFIDRGSVDGLEPGNRLFIVRRGDSWRRTLSTASGTARERIQMDSPRSVDVSVTPLLGDEKALPEEIVGELRVLRTRKRSSMAIVTVSHREIEPGDRAIARKGY
ncbi:MAG: LysM peptidoglycan-binding domain-containing protein [Polyangiaceae bacterium]|nr:LysM peptidoglycan-binding domain-containing protein [Polyangiaceae bacterium]